LGSLPELCLVNVRDRVGDDDVCVVRHPPGLRHGSGTGNEGSSDDSYRRNPLFQFDPVVHTARAAGASISDTDEDQVTLLRDFLEKGSRCGL